MKKNEILGLMTRIHFFILVALCFCFGGYSQTEINYNENAVKPYTIPELLTLETGEKINSVNDWENKRKKEILDIYKNQIYGAIPSNNSITSSLEVVEQSDTAIENSAIRKQIQLVLKKKDKELKINILLYLPKHIKSPHIFVGYNFYGNQTTTNDENIILTNSWVRNNNAFGISNNTATEVSRGKRSNRWPIQKIISEGFGLALIYYGDIDPDKNDFSDGIHPFFYNNSTNVEWGSISAWAWGYSRILDCLKHDELIKQSKFILFGHSRLGKTSLWAGALDDRFDMVISNNSGCGGATLFRRKYGETVSLINKRFPHWFTNNFKKYNDKEELLPIDQHMLIALIAPRPVYIASAIDDKWADPKGEYLAAHHATPVYNLFKKEGLPNSTFPETNSPIHNTIGYHVRSGGHNVTEYDWEQFMKFANKHFNN